MELRVKNILILLLFKHVVIQCGNLLEEYCDADDEDCQDSNDLGKIGQLKHGKSQHVNILRRIRDKSLMECAKECLLTSQCKAINYRKNWKLCDALGERSDGEAIQDESGSIYSDISTWKKALAGKCAGHKCENGKKCIITSNGFRCEHAYCKEDPPETPFAVSTETFGVYASLEAGNQYKCINNNYKLVGKPFVICDKKSKKWKKLFCCVEKPYKPRDCTDLPRHCDSGTYKIYPGTSAGFNIYCHNLTEWWNVCNSATDRWIRQFYRNWTEYEEGFGDLRTEFWLGNRLISQLTLSGKYLLRVRMKNQEQKWMNAWYKGFTIGNVTTGYKLQVEEFGGGDAGDSISNKKQNLYSNGMKFSTYDKDNDLNTRENCAEKYKGAWWFNACHTSHLNGEYDTTLEYPLGIQWSEVLGTLRYSVMEIRRTGPLN